jgi:prolyl-tRNA synthetase
LGIPASCTAKAVLLTARTLNPGQNPLEETVFVVVRGDRAVNETALLDLLGAHELLPANDAQVRALGAVPGYASPIGLPPQAVIVDTEIPISPNLVSGANLHGFHLRNVNCGRDYQPGRVADIALAQPGDPCPNCRAPLASLMGWELVRSHITSGPAATTFMDDNGKPAILQVASWQFYLSRMLGALAEVNQDSSGLCLPLSVAACPVHLVILPGKEGGAALEADLLQEKLLRSGIQVVVDDRPESPGVKFNDADLIGLPLRLTLSERSLRQGGVEIKPRRAEHPTVVPLEGIVEAVREFLAGQEGAGTELGSQDAQSGKQSPGGGKINATGEREHAHFT